MSRRITTATRAYELARDIGVGYSDVLECARELDLDIPSPLAVVEPDDALLIRSRLQPLGSTAMRVYELARALDTETRDVLECARELNLGISSPLANVSPDDANLIRSRLQPVSSTAMRAYELARALDTETRDVLECARELGLGITSPLAGILPDDADRIVAELRAEAAVEPAGPLLTTIDPFPAVFVQPSRSALLKAVAEARGMSTAALERSARRRAQRDRRSFDDVIRGWAETEFLVSSPLAEQEAPEPAIEPETVEAIPPEPSRRQLLTAVAEARGMPVAAVERSAAMRAEKAGLVLDDVIRAWAEDEGLVGLGGRREAAYDDIHHLPVAAPAPTSPGGFSSATWLVLISEASGSPKSRFDRVQKARAREALLAAVAEARGLPASIVEASARERAERTGRTPVEVINEWATAEFLVASSFEERNTDGGSFADDEQQREEPDDAPEPSEIPIEFVLAAVAEIRGMPVAAVEQSARARADKEGRSVDAVIRRWAVSEGLLDDSTSDVRVASRDGGE